MSVYYAPGEARKAIQNKTIASFSGLRKLTKIGKTTATKTAMPSKQMCNPCTMPPFGVLCPQIRVLCPRFGVLCPRTAVNNNQIT